MPGFLCDLAGISRQPTSTINSRPAIATKPPTGEKSNKPNAGSPVSSARRLAMMMFGGVPIIVIMPPRILANAIGNSRMVGERWRSAAVFSATGSMSASAPTLFMKADKTMTTSERLKMCGIWFFVNGITLREIRSTTPELRSARLMISTAATVTTAGCPNPSSTRLGSSTSLDSPPRIASSATNATSAMTATTS